MPFVAGECLKINSSERWSNICFGDVTIFNAIFHGITSKKRLVAWCERIPKFKTHLTNVNIYV